MADFLKKTLLLRSTPPLLILKSIFANNGCHWANFHCCEWPNIEEII